MKSLVTALCCLSLAASPLAFAQEKKDPSPARKKQQERMKDCNAQAKGKKMEGDARKPATGSSRATSARSS